ncbi:hypothetical protein DFH27DRAFT_599441 [Peziza echinospora]|nr:hypothetical protein DFH27DRAFT_599441 [Peziza echinospora]
MAAALYQPLLRGDMRLIPRDSQAAVAVLASLSSGRRAPANIWERILADYFHSDPEESLAVAWVKAHIGTHGNEGADRQAKNGAHNSGKCEYISADGVREAVTNMKKRQRGGWATYEWEKRTLRHFSWAYCDRGPQRSWRAHVRQILHSQDAMPTRRERKFN